MFYKHLGLIIYPTHGGYDRFSDSCHGLKYILVGGFSPPLWKIWLRQLGWWHSQQKWEHKIHGNQTTNQKLYINQLRWLFPIYGKIKLMFQTTNQHKSVSWFTLKHHPFLFFRILPWNKPSSQHGVSLFIGTIIWVKNTPFTNYFSARSGTANWGFP